MPLYKKVHMIKDILFGRVLKLRDCDNCKQSKSHRLIVFQKVVKSQN